MSDLLKVGLAQIAPVWLKRDETLAKISQWVHKAADEGCRLVAFGEALLPGYPFWPELTGGAEFESDMQKELFAWYLKQSVTAEHLGELASQAADRNIHIVLGAVEKAADRGGHSLYCSLFHIDREGTVHAPHRKLVPTYEEKLVWSAGDGHGMRTLPLGDFTIGALNCWENWMPLSRTALYAQGEDLHVAIWPGNERNTRDLTPVIAREGRSYALSVSSLMRRSDVPDDIPFAEEIRDKMSEMPADGGSCIAGPDGRWLVEPVTGRETLLTADLDFHQVARERQNFDPVAHYSRPDVLKLVLNRERQGVLDERN